MRRAGPANRFAGRVLGGTIAWVGHEWPGGMADSCAERWEKLCLSRYYNHRRPTPANCDFLNFSAITSKAVHLEARPPV
jgi:hypothetical protein